MKTILAGDLEVFWRERGEGVPVVLLHGNWSTSMWWQPTLDRVPSGLRAIACDLRGRGRTRGPSSTFSIPSLSHDLERFVDALELGPFHLVGHSLGSAVAMQFALDHPRRLLSLVAVAPAWIDGMPRVFHNEAHQRALKADRDALSRALKALAPMAEEDDHWHRLVDDGHQQDIDAAIKNLDALIEWAPGDDLARVPVRSTVISGERDLLLGQAVPRRVAEALGASHVVIPDVGHCIPIEDPDRFADTLWRALLHEGP